MIVQDSIADMLTRIRNAQKAKLINVQIKMSKFNWNLCSLLKEEGFLLDCKAKDMKKFDVTLKYLYSKPVIEYLSRVSKPSKRIYCKAANIPLSLRGLGSYIISTPQGLLTDRQAAASNVGGEVICEIY